MAASVVYRKTGEACPVCKDSTGVCEHICQSCDRIIEIGTCTNGRCEECCSMQCETPN